MKYVILVTMVLIALLLSISNSYGINSEPQMILREIDGVNRNIQMLAEKSDLTNIRIDTLANQMTIIQKELIAANNIQDIEINNMKNSQKYSGVLWGVLGGAGSTITIGGGSYVVVRRRNGRNNKSASR